jgi:hypothetical protein
MVADVRDVLQGGVLQSAAGSAFMGNVSVTVAPPPAPLLTIIVIAVVVAVAVAAVIALACLCYRFRKPEMNSVVSLSATADARSDLQERLV